MKKAALIFVLFFCINQVSAQNNIEKLLISGVNDAKTFAKSYITPGAESLMYSMNSGWYKTAKVHKPLGFDISLVASGHFVNNADQSFDLNVSDYENIRFEDGSQSKQVATVFGENTPSVSVISRVEENGLNQDIEILLPNGVSSKGVDVLPTAFLQAEVGLFKSTEIKVRYFPKTNIEEVESEMIGFGIQHEITSWLPLGRVLPVDISGLVAYNQLDTQFDFSGDVALRGENQRLELDAETWLFELIASTKLPIINFYGGLGYISGNSDLDLKGTYIIEANIFNQERVLTDPFTVNNDISGLRATVGAKLKLGFFGLNADYTFQEYETISVGIHFGFR
ncbi:MAG: hypothetical protein CO119_09120 [Flavobacteriales bacterium CG_4_9_14_3_um_filter_40_17]|nr:MAG: hypothetical protein CO119_09120 [Flavobacteriales bacterium CG_4_9_14_3_um_filter_40_17]